MKSLVNSIKESLELNEARAKAPETGNSCYDYNGNEYEIADDVNVENDVVDQIIVDEFLSTLSDKDRRILELRIDGTSYERIAELLGYKNHSGVIKRIQKI